MIMTFEQAFNVAMNEYPMLYTARTVTLAKLKFSDQIFNVIGNGISSVSDFESNFTITDANKNIIDSYPSSYITNQPLYTVYRITDTGLSQYLENLYTEQQLEQFSNDPAYVWYRANRLMDNFDPYPNFDSKYSLVYNVDLQQYDSSWTIAAIYFYTKMKEWFNSDSVWKYPAAGHLKDMQTCIVEYERMFKRYEGDAQTLEERNVKISNAYGIEYTGNIEQFIHTRWNNELNRIITFIDETLIKLQQ